MASNFVRRLAGVAVAALVASSLGAQEKKVTLQDLIKMTPEQRAQVPVEQLRAALTVPGVNTGMPTSQPFWRGAPGTSSGSPSGFGAGFRDAFVGGGVQQLLDGGTADGSMSMGFGLGNAKDAVGLETTIASLSSFRSGLFERTAFSFKAHHMVSNSASIAIGVENAIITNKKNEIDPTTVFVAASKVVPGTGWFKQATFSAGVGNGRFRFRKDQQEDNKTVNAFASVGLTLHDQFSVLADWGGPDLAVGVSVVPFKAFPVILTPTLADLTSSNKRFSLGAGIGMKF